MPTNKEVAVLLQKSVKRLQKYTVEDIELALYELSCQREECLRTFIDCNKNVKRVFHYEEKLKKWTTMAQLKDEANRKMAVEYKKMEAETKKLAAENEMLIAENKELRTKNEELTKQNLQQMIQKTADDERARKVC